MKFIKSTITKIITALIVIVLSALSVVLDSRCKTQEDYSGKYSMSGTSGTGMTADVKKAKDGYDISLKITDTNLESYEDSFYIADNDMGKIVTLENGNKLSVEIYEDMMIVYLSKFEEFQEQGSAGYYLGVYNILMPTSGNAGNNSDGKTVVYILRIVAAVFLGLFLLEIALSGKKFVSLIAAAIMIITSAVGIVYTFKNINFEGRYYISSLGEKKSESDYWTYHIYVKKLNDDYRVFINAGNLSIITKEHDLMLFDTVQNGNKLTITNDLDDFIKDMYDLGESFELKQTIKDMKCYKTKNGETKELKVKTEDIKENFTLKISVELVLAVFAVVFVILFIVRKPDKE